MPKTVEFYHPALETASLSPELAHSLLDAVTGLDISLADLDPFTRGKILEAAAIAGVLQESVGDSVGDD